MTGGQAELKISTNNYNIVSFCTNGTDFAMAAETKSGNKFYTKNSIAAVQDNSINAYVPCSSLSISGAKTTYANLGTMTQCATENSTCTFSDTETIIYGYKPFGYFTAIANMTSPVACSNVTFGDPASGYGKACYISNY